ncbi:MAG TPA: GvpL/GvpF family gas vesicle protein [Nitrososphaera sp.]|jgi:hypothetical protein
MKTSVNKRQITKTGKYVYGIAEMHRQSNVAINRLVDHLVGIDQQKVDWICYNDLAAIVSSMPFNRIQKVITNIRAGVKDSISYVLAHQQVVENIRRAGFVILPVRFGSVAKEADVRLLLTKQYSNLKLKIARFQHKDEIGIRIIMTPEGDRKVSQIVQESPEIRRLKSQIQDLSMQPSAHQGSLYFSNLRLNDMINNQRFKRIDEITRQVHQRLAALSGAWSELSKETRQTVFNRSYLVDRSRIKEFESALEDIQRNCSTRYGMTIHQSGPWAPYSFCMNEVVPLIDTSIANDSTHRQRQGNSNPHHYRLVKKDSRTERSKMIA